MQDFFVKLDMPDNLRKQVLETSRDIVKSLQTYERLKQLRVEKIEEVMRLKAIIKDVDGLMLKLKKLFPVVEISDREEFKKPPFCGGRQKKLPEVKGPPVKSPVIDELQKELSKIEEKLNRIS